MSKGEVKIVSVILLSVAIMVVFDIITDFSEGVELSHVLLEGLIAAIALFGVYIILRGSFILKTQLKIERQHVNRLKEDSEKWKNESKKYIEGLSQAIDSQLINWKLTNAEKEIALLLLKGLSTKEIAEVRKTSEKTVRAQSISIYSKSGLSGRSELAAFFLEDLLIPQKDLVSENNSRI